jgi:hypothetical protein
VLSPLVSCCPPPQSWPAYCRSLPTAAVWACLPPQPCLLTRPRRPTHCPACPAQPCILRSLWPTSTTFTRLAHHLCPSCAPPLPVLRTTFTCLAHRPISCRPSCTTSVHPPSVFTPPPAPALPSTACHTAPISRSPCLVPQRPSRTALARPPSVLTRPLALPASPSTTLLISCSPSHAASTPCPVPARLPRGLTHLTQPLPGTTAPIL